MKRTARREAGIRTRLYASIGSVLLVVFVFMAVMSLRLERAEVMRSEQTHAEALLAHLSSMPEFQQDSTEAKERIRSFAPYLSRIGAELDLSAADGAEEEEGLVAERLLALNDGAAILAYRLDPARLSAMSARALAVHALYGSLALAGLLAFTHLILRQLVFRPIERMSHEIELMRSGKGWRPALPRTGDELDRIRSSITGLGPALASQVEEWLETERHSAAELVLRRIRRDVGESLDRLLTLSAELDRNGYLTEEAHARLRELTAELGMLESRFLASERTTAELFVYAPPMNGENR